MPQITKDQLRGLKNKGLSYAGIGRVFGITREWVRRLADEYGIKSNCAACKAEVESARHKYCLKCRQEKRAADAKRWHKNKLKTFVNRPVVLEAYQFFQELGLDVVLNAESKRNEPEIFVNGHGVKCNAIVPVSRGHQCRLGPNYLAAYFYLSDGEYRGDGQTIYVIPGWDVTEQQTYIGAKSDLQMYRVDDELGKHDLAGVLA